LLSREAGEPWQDLNAAIQQIMNDYAGVTFVRSEKLLTTALIYLDQLEQKAKTSIGVKTSHELMRALECFDLLQIGRLICITARERKETRGLHKRSDYTFTNPLLNGKFLTIAEAAGETQLNWREQIK
jgi:succinate dehydrogenase/fumarate reductase flavoprotein subunit